MKRKSNKAPKTGIAGFFGKLGRCILNGFFVLLGLGAFLLLAALAVSGYVVLREKGKILSPEDAAELEDADCILVLGCGLRPGGELSPMLLDRVRRSEELYRVGAAPKLLMSGDHGSNDHNEVGAMKKHAASEGIPEEDIFMDHAGFSTYESMVRAASVFGVKKMIIVTQKYHLYRALYCAEKCGIEAYGVASDYRPYTRAVYREVREVAARSKDLLWCLLKVRPSYEGESVDITGSGSQTDDDAYRDMTGQAFVPAAADKKWCMR